MGEPVDAVGRPARAGGHDDDLGPVLAHVLRLEAAARDDLDVGELVELDAAPVDDAGPLAETGKLRHPAEVPADLGLRVDEVDAAEAALAEDDRALHPRRPGADHEHVLVGVGRSLEPLGVPPTAVFLARGRVLRAAEVVARLALRDARVDPDALPDLAVAAFLDLPGQEGIGDRRPRGADQVPHAAGDDLGHPVGVRQPRHADDRLRRRLAHAAGPLELVALLEEAGGAGVLRPLGDRADVDVPEVDEVVGGTNELERLRRARLRPAPAPPRRCAPRWRSRRRPPPSRPRSSRARSARGSRRSRRTRRCAGCRTARGTGAAGSCARRRRRRCRTPPRASGRLRAPSPRGRA